MQEVTLLIGIVFSILVVILRPAYALGALITCLLWYPSWLRVSLGTIDISAGRIVVSVLLLRCLCDKRIAGRFMWSRLDTWVTVGMAVYVGVYLITRPLSIAMENRAGYVMDTWFAYITARLIITDKATIISVLKFVAIALIPLAVLGIVESVTGWQPFAVLKRFRPWAQGGDHVGRVRLGFYRAMGPITHPIKFGCAQVMFIPLVYCLRHQRGWRLFAYVSTGFVLLGTLSSMSSGPWLMATIAIFCLIMERYKAWVKPMIIFFIISCGIVQIISNRDIHYVIASYGDFIGSGGGAHRAKLIDLALEHFDEWWELGYRGKDPGWGPRLGMGHTDITNMFILNGVYYGILGVIALCGALVVGLRIVISLHNSVDELQLKSFAWALGSWLVVVMTGFLSVSFSGQVETLFYIILGMLGSSANLTRAFPK